MMARSRSQSRYEETRVNRLESFKRKFLGHGSNQNSNPNNFADHINKYEYRTQDVSSSDYSKLNNIPVASNQPSTEYYANHKATGLTKPTYGGELRHVASLQLL
jgi:hypothetical protein